MGKSGRSQGGVIGKVNKTSFGKCKVTSTTATGTLTTGSGTRIVSALVVAGGGGGGGGACCGAGGGAGGANVTSVDVCGSTPYSITIGAGGAAGASSPTPGAKGTASSFAPGTSSAITNCGGGGGGAYGAASFCAARMDGGSGGGAGGGGSPSYCEGTGICGQGYPGGPAAPGSHWNGGGGGGSAAGSSGSPPSGGIGGTGLDVSPTFGCAPQPFYIANSPTAGATACGIFAGGGGGGSFPGHTPTASDGGPGGGGDGGLAANPGSAGVVNSGGGGGGGGDAPGSTPVKPGGLGGSGIVVTKELNKASGVWPMKAQYEARRDDTWPAEPSLPGFNSINLLVIAGGGGGAGGQGGGSGAGGYRFCTTFPISPGNTYKVTVGGGGAKTCGPPQPRPGATSGVNSSFDTCGVGCTYSATGGGVGLYGGNPQPYNTPLTAMDGNPCRSGPGGSGGARGEGNFPDAGVMTGNKGGYSPPEGNNGGNNWSPSGQYSGAGGGGGGAGAVGCNPTATTTSGAGGAGSSAWPGDCTLRAGGGGGSNGSAIYSAGAGGSGGGGQGGNTWTAPAPFGGAGAASGGQTNTGGGAGGAGQGPAPTYCNLSQNGGSGVVIIQYPDTYAGITGGTIAPVPGCMTQHTFNSTDDFVIPF